MPLWRAPNTPETDLRVVPWPPADRPPMQARVQHLPQPRLPKLRRRLAPRPRAVLPNARRHAIPARGPAAAWRGARAAVAEVFARRHAEARQLCQLRQVQGGVHARRAVHAAQHLPPPLARWHR